MAKSEERAADKILRGLDEAVEIAKGKKKAARIHRVIVPTPDVRRIREGLELTQEQFSADYGIPIQTLRHWEQGLREPPAPAKAYLAVIEHEPKAVRRALKKVAG